MKIIGIHGKARSGKDTAGEYLYSRLLSNAILPEKTSFAAPMKQMLSVGLNIPSVWLRSAIKDQQISDYNTTPRHMMQTLGTEWGRKMIHPDVWVIALHNQIKGSSKTFIITDVRFENEADYCRKHGMLIHIVGRGGIDSDHVSEKGLDVETGDVVIDNSGTINDLHDNLKEIELC